MTNSAAKNQLDDPNPTITIISQTQQFQSLRHLVEFEFQIKGLEEGDVVFDGFKFPPIFSPFLNGVEATHVCLDNSCCLDFLIGASIIGFGKPRCEARVGREEGDAPSRPAKTSVRACYAPVSVPPPQSIITYPSDVRRIFGILVHIYSDKYRVS
jgi:hypothetical protein